MKTTFIFCLLLILFSCEKEPVTPAFSFNPEATVKIKPSGLKSVSTVHLSDLEIVKQTTALQSYYNDPYINQGVIKFERVFDELQRDIVSTPPCLKMWATDILKEDGTLELAFIESHDCILLNFDLKIAGAPRDTLGYIKNSTLRTFEAQIKALYALQDYEAIYTLFNEAYTFTPITGAEYKVLKAQNLQ